MSHLDTPAGPMAPRPQDPETNGHLRIETATITDHARDGIDQVLKDATAGENAYVDWVYPDIHAIPALAIGTAIDELQLDSDLPSVKRTFAFTPRYGARNSIPHPVTLQAEIRRSPEYPPNEVVDVIIKGMESDFMLEVRYRKNDRMAHVSGISDAGNLKGTGTYTDLLTNTLRGIDRVFNSVNQAEIGMAKDIGNGDPAHALLAGVSSIARARRGFLTWIDKESTLEAQRVPRSLSLLLDQSALLVRQIREGKPVTVDAMLLADLLQLWKDGAPDKDTWSEEERLAWDVLMQDGSKYHRRYKAQFLNALRNEIEFVRDIADGVIGADTL